MTPASMTSVSRNDILEVDGGAWLGGPELAFEGKTL